MTEYAREFGKHLLSLRRVRGITQEQLACRTRLSPDTIRRLEHGSFNASIETIRKLCLGLGISPSTLFESFELGDHDVRRELVDLLACRDPRDLAVLIRVVHVVLAELEARPR